MIENSSELKKNQLNCLFSLSVFEIPSSKT